MHFTGRELTLDEYTTLDINRQGDQLHINATNTGQDMAFNSFYDKILEHLGDDETFTITIKKEKGAATFTDMTADYYLNSAAEILHFGRRIAEQKQDENEA